MTEAMAIGLVFLLGGIVKGVMGVGMPTLVIGLLGLAMPPASAAALLTVPNLVTNAWQSAGPGFRVLAVRLWPLLLALVAGLVAAAPLVAGGGAALRVVLGLLLIANALLGLLAVRMEVPPGRESVAGPITGAATGTLAAATGVFVIPAVPYLQALGLQRDALVQAMGLTFLASTVALAAVQAVQGVLSVATAGASVAALVPALAGMWLGTRLRTRIPPATFRRWFLISLLALGAVLALKPLV
jgi:hypothetical protein